MSDPFSDPNLLADTLQGPSASIDQIDFSGVGQLSLGIIWHQNTDRIGETAAVQFDRSGEFQLSRLYPLFQSQEDQTRSPLTDQRLSRSPLIIKRMSERTFQFQRPEKPIQIEINGQLLNPEKTVSLDDLGDDIIMTLSNSVVLSLFYAAPVQAGSKPVDDLDLLGISRGIVTVRSDIKQVAGMDLPVFIRGETGTGKELVAKALHQLGKRSDRPFLKVNMATITPSLATSELFGTKRGAYTGAVKDQQGLFEQAHNNTLFLDEIGDTSPEVQPMLLRVLEAGEIKRVGDTIIRKVDVRVIAATDRSLDVHPGEPSFSQPLLRRLEAVTINIPPLSHRRVDIGLLIKSFCAAQQNPISLLETDTFSTQTITQLAISRWPGNVRELQNTVMKIFLRQPWRVNQTGQKNGTEITDQSTQRPTAIRYRSPTEVDELSLLQALDACEWIIKDAAEMLQISRTSMYEIMRRSPDVKHINDISASDIETTMNMVRGGVGAWAKHLRVGRDALDKRIRAMLGVHSKTIFTPLRRS